MYFSLHLLRFHLLLKDLSRQYKKITRPTNANEAGEPQARNFYSFLIFAFPTPYIFFLPSSLSHLLRFQPLASLTCTFPFIFYVSIYCLRILVAKIKEVGRSISFVNVHLHANSLRYPPLFHSRKTSNIRSCSPRVFLLSSPSHRRSTPLMQIPLTQSITFTVLGRSLLSS